MYSVQSPEAQVIRSASTPLAESAGWMKFLGILSIIGGVSQALSLVGILWAWLPIWTGFLLYQAASAADTARLTGDHAALATANNHLKTYFMINGILTLLGILIGLAMLCLLVILPMLGLIPFLINPNQLKNL